jgi:hypothetical protein
LNVEQQNPPNENVWFYDNVWSDPAATMADFSDTPPGETLAFALDGNLYWNGGSAIPSSASDLLNATNDTHRVVADPRLTVPAGVTLPRWVESNARFADGSGSVGGVFTNLVERYAKPAAGSAAVDAGIPAHAAMEDILGHPRGTAPDRGAYELGSATGVEDPGLEVASLEPGFPNPFRGQIGFAYRMTRPGQVRIDVYDAAGRQVRALVNAPAEPGLHRFIWDGRSADRRMVPAGPYFVRLRAGGTIRVVKVIRLAPGP